MRLEPSTVGPGDTFSATTTECTVGETVTFEVQGDSDASTCTSDSPAGGPSAIGELAAPSTPGNYEVSSLGATSGLTSSATLSVVGDIDDDDVLPTTGSDSNQIVPIAGAVLIAGLGLAAVAWRRRQHALT